MLGAGLLCLSSCGGQTQTEQTPAVDKSSAKNQVIETIMTRRSVRKYLPQPVNRDTMQMILDLSDPQAAGQRGRQPEIKVEEKEPKGENRDKKVACTRRKPTNR